MVSVNNLQKSFQVAKRQPGFLAAMKSLVHRPKETVHAVRGISFEIAAGERVGFLGPNGAGKTTTLKMLAGLLHPSGGTVTVLGERPFERTTSFLRKITLVMGQKQQLIWDIPPADTFALNRALYGIPTEQYNTVLGELGELLDVASVMFKPTRQLSLGERMKCELIAALLHQPKVLFLDEPTIGLDLSMQSAVREFIATYNQRFEATVLLTSHYMEDVVALCQRVIVIDHGEIVYDGDLRHLAHSVRPDKIVSFQLPLSDNTDNHSRLLSEMQNFGTLVKQDKSQFTFQIAHQELRAALSHLVGRYSVGDLTVLDPPIEDVIRQLFRTGADEREKNRESA